MTAKLPPPSTMPALVEIDWTRGVLYVHLTRDKDIAEYGTVTVLRVCRMGKLTPGKSIDITHMQGLSQ